MWVDNFLNDRFIQFQFTYLYATTVSHQTISLSFFHFVSSNSPSILTIKSNSQKDLIYNRTQSSYQQEFDDSSYRTTESKGSNLFQKSLFIPRSIRLFTTSSSPKHHILQEIKTDQTLTGFSSTKNEMSNRVINYPTKPRRGLVQICVDWHLS